MTDKTDFWEGLVTLQYQGQAVVKERLYVVSACWTSRLNVHQPAHCGSKDGHDGVFTVGERQV